MCNIATTLCSWQRVWFLQYLDSGSSTVKPAPSQPSRCTGEVYCYRFNGETRQGDEGMKGIEEEKSIKDYLCYISTKLSHRFFLLLI